MFLTKKIPLVLSADKITEYFYIIDELNKNFRKTISLQTIKPNNTIKTRNRQSKNVSLWMFKNLKDFYTKYVQKYIKNEFQQTVSYNQFVYYTEFT